MSRYLADVRTRLIALDPKAWRLIEAADEIIEMAKEEGLVLPDHQDWKDDLRKAV